MELEPGTGNTPPATVIGCGETLTRWLERLGPASLSTTWDATPGDARELLELLRALQAELESPHARLGRWLVGREP
jgi:hypothetical protein